MADLLSLLSLGSSAMSAQNAAVATATNNVANVNTAGYSRESVDFEAVQGPPTVGGVVASAATRTASELLDGRVRDAGSSLGRSTTTSSTLGDLEATLASGAQVSDQLASVFARMQQVAAAPTDPSQRQAAVAALQSLVSTFHTTASTLSDASTQADQQIGTIATSATSLATQLAAANKAVAAGNDPTALDNRDQIASQLTALVGGSARVDPDGQMRFVLDGGAVLVDGTHAAAMTTSPDATTGLTDINVVDGTTTRDVTAQISGGQLGGTLSARTQIVALQGQTDQLASDVATGFNNVSTANAGSDGVTGRNTFVPPTQVAGAAAALTLDPGLAADPTQLATAAPGAGPGDNTGALALAALATAKVASGGTQTLTDASLVPTTTLAQTVSDAKADATADQLVSSHMSDLQDSLSGVDLTEEQNDLSRFSAASQALGKFVTTINDMLDTFITNV